jgi:hypothetical protein
MSAIKIAGILLEAPSRVADGATAPRRYSTRCPSSPRLSGAGNAAPGTLHIRRAPRETTRRGKTLAEVVDHTIDRPRPIELDHGMPASPRLVD